MINTEIIYKKYLAELKELGNNKNINERLWVQKYLGSNKPTQCIRTGDVQKLARKIINENNLNEKELENLVDLFYSKAKTFEEIDLAAKLLGAAPKLRQKMDVNKLDYWLNFTYGWAETDVLCQSNFTSDEILSNRNTWKKLLINLNKDKNIQKRRASLVLLTKAVRMSEDKRLSKMAFRNVDLLKKEKEILITKAISWILRSLIKNHKKEVSEYLKINKEILPKIAVREVTNKLETGVKNKKVKK
jgi:3-methyladenine DNA glycosylase AlkD